MEGTGRSVSSTDGVRIGLLTAGSGPGLLLVHGGMGTIGSWQRVWDALTLQRRVTAMDRRGRGSSGDADHYEPNHIASQPDTGRPAPSSGPNGLDDTTGHGAGPDNHR
jgi:pimeloyl-ACP methyl ester carboxylesterase